MPLNIVFRMKMRHSILSFDFCIYAPSPEELEHYVSEIVRVLKKDGDVLLRSFNKS